MDNCGDFRGCRQSLGYGQSRSCRQSGSDTSRQSGSVVPSYHDYFVMERWSRKLFVGSKRFVVSAGRRCSAEKLARELWLNPIRARTI